MKKRSEIMSLVRARNTKPELKVRRLLFGMGYRYRLHRGDLPGCPDIVFPGRKKIIFVNGCFWHGHNCPAGLNRPKTNKLYWEQKLEKNMIRDKKNREKLKKMEWEVFVIWECQLKNKERLSTDLVSFLENKSIK